MNETEIWSTKRIENGAIAQRAVWRNGGISPQKRQCDFGSFVPARASV